MTYSILFVDDEQNVLSAYKRNLRKFFDVHTALSGTEALELLKGKHNFSVIVSDMQMPNMNGVEFFKIAKESSKNSVRIMLTGNADQQTAIDAINEGDIYRFVNKPCSPEQILKILKVAIKQHLLMIAEQELLKTTLKSSIEVLIETLTLACPRSFGPINVIKDHMVNCVRAMGAKNTWMYESMAMLALVGYIGLPESLLLKISEGGILTKDEEDEYVKHSEIAYKLISKIPRLGDISQAIRLQNKHFDGGGFPDHDIAGKEIPIGARILKLSLDYERFLGMTKSREEALLQLEKNSHRYDPRIKQFFIQSLRVLDKGDIVDVGLLNLEKGMIVAKDIFSTKETLLVSKGQKITDSLIDRLSNFNIQKQLPPIFSVYRVEK
jgi:response regulator RpfG family c-di-GMP phosphodiesterase